MKRLLMLLPIFLMVSCSGEKGNDWEEMNLKGEVKSSWERRYSAYEGDGGKPVKLNLEMSVLSKFDEKGRLLALCSLDANNDTIRKIVSLYNEKGVLERKEVYDGLGELQNYSTFAYDEKRRVVETLYYDVHGELLQKDKSIYNDDNLIETMTELDAYGKLLKKIEIQKTKDGFPSWVKVYNEEMALVNNRKEEYDKEGNLVHFIVYSSDETIKFLEVNMSYDKGGNLVKYTGIDENEVEFLPQTYKYVFDEKTNWISSVELVDGEVKFLTEREFSYY